MVKLSIQTKQITAPIESLHASVAIARRAHHFPFKGVRIPLSIVWVAPPLTVLAFLPAGKSLILILFFVCVLIFWFYWLIFPANGSNKPQ